MAARIFRLITVCLLFLLISSTSLAQGAKEPPIKADGAVLMDLDSGFVLYEQNPQRKMHPASLTKIMTGLLAIEKGQLDQEVTIGENPPKIYIGQTIDLRKGEILTLRDLVKAALMVSANDSTVAIGDHIGGHPQLFVHWMNQKAYTIGAYNTRYVNTNGYSVPNHLTTPYDLALITRYAMFNSQFAKIVSTKEDEISRISFKRGKKEVKIVPIRNTNRLLWDSGEIVGVKTGTTARAGGCLISAARRNGRTLIAVVLHAGKNRRYSDSLNLYEYGFKNFHWQERIKQGETVKEIKVKNGRKDTLGVVAKRSLFAIHKISDKDNSVVKIVLPEKVRAPISKGQVLGKVYLYQGKAVLDQTDLISPTEVKNFLSFGK